MKTRLPTGRTVAGLIAVCFALVGLYFLSESRRMEQRFEKQSEVLPLDMAIDLSQPGQFSAPFQQSWQACHGQSIALQLSSDEIDAASMEQIFASLDFDWHVADPSGSIVAEGHVSDFSMREKTVADGQVDLDYMYPFELGEYTFTCLVTNGAPALEGIEQRLVSEYRPCGMELMPAAISQFIGIFSLIISGGIVFPLVMMTAADTFGRLKAKAIASNQQTSNEMRS